MALNTLDIDPQVIAELMSFSNETVIPPAVERNFGDDTDAEFRASTEVVTPSTSHVRLGETAVEAHLRLQAERAHN